MGRTPAVEKRDNIEREGGGERKKKKEIKRKQKRKKKPAPCMAAHLF
jgi:hypothetical protein